MQYSHKLFLYFVLGCLLIQFTSISATEMENDVSSALNGNTVVVLFFSDDALTSCNVVESNLEGVIDSYGDSVIYFKIDILDEDSSDLMDEYSVDLAPTVVIFDELGDMYEHIFGIKSSDYYENSIFEAMKVDNTLIYNANKYYNNGIQFYESKDFDKASYYFLQAESLYRDLGDVSKRLVCQLYGQKCEDYITAYELFDQAENLFSLNDFTAAQAKYSDSVTYFGKVGDLDLVNYCTMQIDYCILYPSLTELYQQSLSLMSQNNYTSALISLTELKAGYDQVGDTTQSANISSMITKCNDYITANGYMSEGANHISNNLYQNAIISYDAAKEIYSQYMDYEKVALCDQNIAVAQQFIDLQSVEDDSEQTDEENEYPIDMIYIYAFAVLILILLVSIFIIKRSGNSNSQNREKIVPPPPIKKVQKMPDEPAVDYDEVALQSMAIEKKNELLKFFSSWIEDLLNDIKNSPATEREHARSSFEDLSKVFLMTFNKDEIYLDQEMLYNAFINLHTIQVLLAE